MADDADAGHAAPDADQHHEDVSKQAPGESPRDFIARRMREEAERAGGKTDDPERSDRG